MDNALLMLMPDTVTLEPYAGQDAYGTPSYGAASSYQCAVQGYVEASTAFDISKVAHVKVYLASITGVTTRDRITLPVRYTPNQPKILKVHHLADENGAFAEVIET